MSDQRPFRIEQRMTTPSKPGKAPRPVWVAVGVTYGYEDVFPDMGGKKWRGEWSFWEDPTAALEGAQPESFAERREHFKERAEDRAERREEWSSKAQKRSDAALDRSHQTLDRIPLGQPILVGHHSERRHRADLKRADGAMRVSVEEGKTARYHSDRADAARRNADDRVSLPSMVARRDTALAEVRRCNREIAGRLAYRGEPGEAPRLQRVMPSDGERQRLEAVRAEYQDRADYWQGRIDAAGGVPHSKATMKPGQLVRIRGEWWVVTRCNPKTVSVEKPVDPFKPNAYRWPMKYDYAEIKDVRGPEVAS